MACNAILESLTTTTSTGDLVSSTAKKSAASAAVNAEANRRPKHKRIGILDWKRKHFESLLLHAVRPYETVICLFAFSLLSL